MGRARTSGYISGTDCFAIVPEAGGAGGGGDSGGGVLDESEPSEPELLPLDEEGGVDDSEDSEPLPSSAPSNRTVSSGDGSSSSSLGTTSGVGF